MRRVHTVECFTNSHQQDSWRTTNIFKLGACREDPVKIKSSAMHLDIWWPSELDSSQQLSKK